MGSWKNQSFSCIQKKIDSSPASNAYTENSILGKYISHQIPKRIAFRRFDAR
jgi:hypothetical protein